MIVHSLRLCKIAYDLGSVFISDSYSFHLYYDGHASYYQREEVILLLLMCYTALGYAYIPRCIAAKHSTGQQLTVVNFR